MADDTTIRIKKITKNRLDELPFVKKGWSYDDIIIELMKDG